MTGVPLITTQTLESEQDMLEGARHLVFAHQYTAAAKLLETAPVQRAELTYWYAFALVSSNDLERALRVLHEALARGQRGVLGVLAVAQRLRGENRAYLESVTPSECAALDPFQKALLEREIGAWHLEQERFESAVVWLESAWRTALTGAFGDQQLAGIATPLAAALARLGLDARAVSILDEGLHRADRTRRTPLLFERCLRNLALGRLEAMESDLAELEVCVPGGDLELGLLVGYARARYVHALGATSEARAAFRTVFDRAANHAGSRTALRELALHSALWLTTLALEADQSEDALSWLECAGVHTCGVRDLAWLTLRQAQTAALIGEYVTAAEGLASSARGFSSLGARVECAVAHLHRANALLQLGFEFEDQAGEALLEAAQLMREVGGAAPLRLEVRTLPRLRAYLEQPYAHAEVKSLLEPLHTHRRLRLIADDLECDGVRLGVSVSAARLVRYLRDHPGSTWAHLCSGVYSGMPSSAARLAFEGDRAMISSIDGLEICYAGAGHAYSLAWSAMTLEVAPSQTDTLVA